MQTQPAVWLAAIKEEWITTLSPNLMRKDVSSIISLEICSFKTKVLTFKPNKNVIIDETGKYKTGKCSIELFFSVAHKNGIELTEAIE